MINTVEPEERKKPKCELGTLRPLVGIPIERRFCSVDIETYEWVNAYAAGFFDGTEYVDFIGEDCVAQVLMHALKPEYAGSWIYAHNGGGFDFLFFMDKFLRDPVFKRRYFIEMTPVGSGLLAITVNERDKDFPNEAKKTKKRVMKWTFVDSLRLMPVALNELGQTFGLGKKVELNITYDELAKPENRELMREYLKKDCLLLYRAVEKLQNTILSMGGQMCLTLPATSLDIFRRAFQEREIFTNRHFVECDFYGMDPPKKKKKGAELLDDGRCKGCMHDFFREAYYGGRSEIFRMKYQALGDDVGRVYDINSHYPHCMLENMPTGQAIELFGLTGREVMANCRSLIGIVDCDVYIPEDCYLPPLPVRSDGKLVFPTGYLRGTWDTCELELVERVGGKIIRTRKSTWFQTEPVFERFVRRLYKFRDKSDPNWNMGMDFIAKIILNSAYGKFAMREDRQKYIVNPYDTEGLECVSFENDVWAEDVYISPNYICPQLSVHITALARRRLWEILRKVVDAGGKVYYCDTDSIVCSGVTLPTGNTLGALKLENTIVRAEFVLPKFYLIETLEQAKAKKKEAALKIKAKGMGPGIKVNIETQERLRRLKDMVGVRFAGDDQPDKEEGEYAGQLSLAEFNDMVRKGFPVSRHRLTKFRECLSDLHKGATTFPQIKMVPKQIRTAYDKRHVLDDFDTRPLVFQHFDSAGNALTKASRVYVDDIYATN